MPRGPRLEYPGFYHVINRGVEQRDIFLDDADHQVFIDVLQESAHTFSVKVPSFCLMDNHYHLLIQTEDENLSKFMKQVNARYSIYFNRRYKRVGPLWQGRFKSWYVYDEDYLQSLVRYIESNPVRAGITDKVSEFRWSMSSRQSALACLDYSLIDNIDFSKPIDDEEYATIEKLYKAKIDRKDSEISVKKRKKLEEYFDRYPREFAIANAIEDGHRQTTIAKYLSLSDVSVSRTYKRYREKVKLFDRLKGKGLFWSYAQDTTYQKIGVDVTIEHVLKYGDFDDIKDVMRLYGQRVVKSVWEKSMREDKRYIRPNVMIARVFFNMDVESSDLKEVGNARAQRLRMLAS